MHIFLTGPLQSGKSTAIARYLVGRPEAPGGFRTHWDRAGGRLTLELLETGETLSVATMEPHGVRADRAAFDAAGERLLSAPAGRRSLLLMDELGFLERCSPVFQRAVFTLLDGPTPVLGVLRRHAKSPFWGPSCVIVSSIIHALVFEDRILNYEEVIGIAIVKAGSGWTDMGQ